MGAAVKGQKAQIHEEVRLAQKAASDVDDHVGFFAIVVGRAIADVDDRSDARPQRPAKPLPEIAFAAYREITEKVAVCHRFSEAVAKLYPAKAELETLVKASGSCAAFARALTSLMDPLRAAVTWTEVFVAHDDYDRLGAAVYIRAVGAQVIRVAALTEALTERCQQIAGRCGTGVEAPRPLVAAVPTAADRPTSSPSLQPRGQTPDLGPAVRVPAKDLDKSLRGTWDVVLQFGPFGDRLLVVLDVSIFGGHKFRQLSMTGTVAFGEWNVPSAGMLHLHARGPQVFDEILTVEVVGPHAFRSRGTSGAVGWWQRSAKGRPLPVPG